MSTERDQLVAEAVKVNAERTALIAWLEDSLAAERAQAAKATDADTQYWAKWTAHHFERLLSFLASEGEQVKALEHRITELEAGDACFTPTQTDVHLAVVKERDRYKREASAYEELEARLCPEDRGFEEVITLLRADRDRMTAEVEGLKANHGFGVAVCYKHAKEAEYQAGKPCLVCRADKAEADLADLTQRFARVSTSLAERMDYIRALKAFVLDEPSRDGYHAFYQAAFIDMRNKMIELEAQR